MIARPRGAGARAGLAGGTLLLLLTASVYRAAMSTLTPNRLFEAVPLLGGVQFVKRSKAVASARSVGGTQRGIMPDCIDDQFMSDCVDYMFAEEMASMCSCIAGLSWTSCDDGTANELQSLVDSDCLDPGDARGMGNTPQCVQQAVEDASCNQLWDKAEFEAYCECWKGLDTTACDAETRQEIESRTAAGCSLTGVNYFEKHGDECLTAPDGRLRCWDELLPPLAVNPLTGGVYLADGSNAEGNFVVPLVVDLHGASDSPAGQRKMSGFEELASSEGFAVVWPCGLHEAWTAGRGFGYPQVDDVGFLSAMIESVSARFPVDHARVYVTGISNGCAMGQLLAATRNDLVAAVACTSLYLLERPAVSWMPWLFSPNPAILEVHATDDLIAPYEGGGEEELPSAVENFETWGEINSCRGTPEDSLHEGTLIGGELLDFSLIHSNDAKYTRRRYASCQGGSEVELITVFGSGHMNYMGYDAGDLDTTRLMWEFMRRFRLAAARPLATTWAAFAGSVIDPMHARFQNAVEGAAMALCKKMPETCLGEGSDRERRLL